MRSRGGLPRAGTVIDLTLDPADGQGLAWLYEHAEVLRRSEGEVSGVVSLTIRVPPNGRIRCGQGLAPSSRVDSTAKPGSPG